MTTEWPKFRFALIATEVELGSGTLSIREVLNVLAGSALPIKKPHILAAVFLLDPAGSPDLPIKSELFDPTGASKFVAVHTIPATPGSPGALFDTFTFRMTIELAYDRPGLWEWVLSHEGRELTRVPLHIVVMGPAGRA